MTLTTDSLAAARKAAAVQHEKKKLADFELVSAWQKFLKDEQTAHAAVVAGELDRDIWAAMWAAAPPTPTTAQYNNAREVAALVPQ